MPKEQRIFTKEFKLEAVHLAQTSGKSQSQVARDLGIADSTLHHVTQSIKWPFRTTNAFFGKFQNEVSRSNLSHPFGCRVTSNAEIASKASTIRS